MFMVREVPIISVGSDNRWMTLVLILNSNIVEIIRNTGAKGLELGVARCTPKGSHIGVWIIQDGFGVSPLIPIEDNTIIIGGTPSASWLWCCIIELLGHMLW
jgi:hypothetical protein